MRKPIHVVLAIVVLVCSAVASAQVPTYTPYGAWRGRIRYVEGPWRTRSTIHWGNGVTPTGGQVIMQGLTAAESVLTNPDFLNKVLSGGLRDAESVAESEARNAEIQAAILDIRTRNQTIANLNAPVLEAWNLEPTKLVALEVVPDAGGSESPTVPSASDLYDSYMKLGETIAELPGKIQASAAKASAYGQFVESHGISWGLKEDQLESVKQFNGFVSRVLASLPKGAPAETAEDLAKQPPEKLVTDYAITLMELFENCKQVTRVSAERMKVAEELNKIVVLPVVEKSIENVKAISAKAASWGDIPAIEKDTFDMPGPPAAPAANDPFGAPAAPAAPAADDPFGAPAAPAAPAADDPFGAHAAPPAPAADDPFGAHAASAAFLLG